MFHVSHDFQAVRIVIIEITRICGSRFLLRKNDEISTRVAYI